MATSVLLIESESPLVRLAAWFLVEAGFHVSKAEYCSAAEQLSRERPDVVIFNTLGCPQEKRSCIDSLRRLAQLPPILDIFEPRVLPSPVDTGADRYLPVPFDADTLLEVVHHLMR